MLLLAKPQLRGLLFAMFLSAVVNYRKADRARATRMDHCAGYHAYLAVIGCMEGYQVAHFFTINKSSSRFSAGIRQAVDIVEHFVSPLGFVSMSKSSHEGHSVATAFYKICKIKYEGP
jgi:hypothetical protein